VQDYKPTTNANCTTIIVIHTPTATVTIFIIHTTAATVNRTINIVSCGQTLTARLPLEKRCCTDKCGRTLQESADRDGFKS
jgi:hypothetical protein